MRGVANRPSAAYAALGLLLVVACGASLITGQGDLGDERLRPLLLALRGQRLLAALIAGAALATAGVIVQGLFRNPLASPSVIGTTAGAALGGRLALLAHQLLAQGIAQRFVAPEMLLPLGCVGGALGALVVLLLVDRQRGDLVTLLLTGFLLSSLFVSLGGLLISIAEDRWELARAMIVFALGDLSGAGPRQVLAATPLLFFGMAAAWLWGRPLDLMLSGEEEAASLGVDVRTLRRWAIVWTALLTGAAVALGGSIGFVGLIVPHAVRPFVGVAHRALVPAAALLGGGFLVLCDLLCRLLPGGELPLGVVTGVIGAPLFLTLLLHHRRGRAL